MCRRVIVKPDQTRLADLGRIFGSFDERFEDLLDDYTDEQLAVITDFLRRAAQRSREVMAHLSQGA